MDALEGVRKPLKIDESFESLDHSVVSFDLRAGTNLRMGEGSNASDNNR